ncbi:MAG: hypothetical protein KAH17_04820 [Bacteroidales bacterium]|nr:hypothetical protein [Bacteroidales bacterium]
MSICKHCGVEIEGEFSQCPLCQRPSHSELHQNSTITSAYNPGYSPLSTKEKSRLFWELATILHFSALVVTILIDIITNKRPTWSLYAITSIAASYIFITLLTFTTRKLWIFLPGLLINTLSFLVLIDLYDNGINWFVNPGLPLAGFFIILLGGVMAFAFRTSQKGFNIIALVSLAIGLYCILAEIFIKMANNLEVTLSWSAIVAASILPFALLLFFLHYRLKRGTSLRKFFHL